MEGVQWGARIGCRLIDRTATLCKGGRNTRVLGVTRKGRGTSETGSTITGCAVPETVHSVLKPNSLEYQCYRGIQIIQTHKC